VGAPFNVLPQGATDVVAPLLGNKSSIYKISSVVTKLMLKILWLRFFCGHRVH